MFQFLLVFLFKAYGSTVLLQGPQSPPFEYKAMLKAHADLISPTEDFLRNHPAQIHREKLLALFADAQKSFLENSNEEAAVKFRGVLALLNLDDWEAGDREIFLQCFLRLAQLETSSAAKDRWLGLSLLLFDVNIDRSLFPPPLLARRSELALSLPARDPLKHLFGAGWTRVLVNGHECHKGECSSIPAYPGPLRITVLSDQWQPQSGVMDLTEAEKFQPPSVAWAEGDCEDTKMSAAAQQIPDKRVFWGLNCARQIAPPVNLKPASLQPAVAPTPLPLFTTAAPQTAPIYQSKWFWVGVSAVVVAVVVASAQKRETKEPSTTYGY